MSDPQEKDHSDPRLAGLREGAGPLLEKFQFASAHRLYGEMRRLARAEQQAIAYMLATFHQMDLSLDLQDPDRARELAVELIALLESPDRARAIQPDLPEPQHEDTCAWMTACAYENLAE